MTLGLDPELLHTCVQCGLCLSSCPTFRVSGDESMSPRGRIALMRHVEAGRAPLDDDVLDSFATCVQCRACEPACPSGVQYGRLVEQVRIALVDDPNVTPRRVRMLLRIIRRPRVLRLATLLLGLGQRLNLVPRSLDPGIRVPLRQPAMRASGGDVVLFTGCVMDAWQRDVHRDVQYVLECAGVGVLPSGNVVGCCGALHSHAGANDAARRMATHVMQSLPPEVPVLVDAAGCGAALKDYGHLLGTTAAAEFSRRVFDVHEWLAARIDELPDAPRLDRHVVVQDPCHLRNVQRTHRTVHDLLRRYVAKVDELDTEGLCCGAGGAYSFGQRSLADQIRARTVAAIARSSADLVVSANPGCALHLAAASIATAHPLQLVAEALRSADAQRP